MGDDFNDVYIAPEDYVKVGMKQLVAERLVGWLNAYAEYENVAGNTQSAEDAQAIANRIEYQIESIKEE
jgi:hypothetical protein